MLVPTFTRATPGDAGTLVLLMREFYACERLNYSAATAAAADALLVNPALGHVYLVCLNGNPAGYFVLTFSYSLERGGLTALIDELFVLPAARKKGLATASIQFAIATCQSLGCRALLLEVDHSNTVARNIYHRAGFIRLPRDFLALPLRSP